MSAQKSATTSKVRLSRTESQKKRIAAKAAETRARNKAAKAAKATLAQGESLAVDSFNTIQFYYRKSRSIQW